MRLLKSLPLSLVLLIADYSIPSEASLVPRAIQKVHKHAARQTHSLARDLRVAFAGMLVSRDDTSSTTQQRVVYCKPKQAVMGKPGSGGGSSTGGGNVTTTKGYPTSSATGAKTAQSGHPSATNVPSSPWKIQQSYSGNNFFDGWTFSQGSDPTNGIVNYIDQGAAQSSGLLAINSNGNAVMRVETTPTVNNVRNSIRITTQYQFNGGLVILDAVHMPTGCGTWPAFWSNGPNWPHGGEIDIVEGVNDYTNNQATIHTDVGCTIASTNQSVLDITGSVIGGTDCAALTTGNQGCGIRASTSNSFGPGFNSNGGGIYAMKWDTTGIAVYFFPRGTEPADIDAGAPQPDTWGPAQARWPATSCDPFQFFSDHSVIFDTTLCGDWAGAVWSGSGIPGQEQSCAQRTGFGTCQDFVRASGSAKSKQKPKLMTSLYPLFARLAITSFLVPQMQPSGFGFW